MSSHKLTLSPKTFKLSLRNLIYFAKLINFIEACNSHDATASHQPPVPKREVSIPESSLGLNPLKRQMNVSFRLRVRSYTFIR